MDVQSTNYREKENGRKCGKKLAVRILFFLKSVFALIVLKVIFGLINQKKKKKTKKKKKKRKIELLFVIAKQLHFPVTSTKVCVVSLPIEAAVISGFCCG